jgi:hypothetical protein
MNVPRLLESVVRSLFHRPIGVIVLVLCLAPASGHAVLVQVGFPGAGGVRIADNAADDLAPATAGTIRFEQEIIDPGDRNVRFITSGTVTENIDPGKSAVLTLTEFDVRATGTGRVSDIIVFETGIFAPIPPPSTGTVHLDGQYRVFRAEGGQRILNADVELLGFADAVQIGIVDPPPARNAASPVGFAPADVTRELANPVTRLFGHLAFRLEPGDAIRLPTSARVAVVAPEPGSLLLLAVGLAVVMILRAGRYRKTVTGGSPGSSGK